MKEIQSVLNKKLRKIEADMIQSFGTVFIEDVCAGIKN